MGRYTILWPTNEPFARDLLLASNAGSGGLGSLEAKGGLYIQNNPALPGYNPNEEHALMQGGQAWALRDDLNITNGANYSSHPYVLLEYTATDGRPSMTVFQVLREKGNIKFDYTLNAGTLLQAPMPLPLMEKPLVELGVGTKPRSANFEITNSLVTYGSAHNAGPYSLLSFITRDRHFFGRNEALALSYIPGLTVTQRVTVDFGTNSLYLNTNALFLVGQLTNLFQAEVVTNSITNLSAKVTNKWFYCTDSEPAAHRLVGVVTTAPPLSLGLWTGGAQPTDTTKYRYRVASLDGLNSGQQVIVGSVADEAKTTWNAFISALGTGANNFSYVELQFDRPTPAAAQTNAVLVLPDPGVRKPSMFVGWRLAYETTPDTISDPAIWSRYASFTFQDRKGDTWLYRGPHQTNGAAKMVMQFYYKTLAGFYYPMRAHNAQPTVGTITPYLRPLNPDGVYEGDPVQGDLNFANNGTGNPLGITYRAVWSDNTPVLMMAETLATTKRGLPAMRGQSSLQILYQQSHVPGGLTNITAVLHDPTRQKQSLLAPPGDQVKLTQIPGSVRTSTYNGKTYFPNLPPHLVERFFLDPARGANGALVFGGQFKQEIVGDSYFFLNLLGQQDATVLKELCSEKAK